MRGKTSRLLGPKWTHIESWKLEKGYDIKELADVLLTICSIPCNYVQLLRKLGADIHGYSTTRYCKYSLKVPTKVTRC